VGTAFVVLGGLLRWRGHPLGAIVAGTAGATLSIGAVLAPALLGPVQAGWTRLSVVLGKVTTPIFLGVVYFGLFLPIGLVRRLFGRDSLKRARGQASFWVVRSRGGGRRSDLRRQF
jgi:hypothetical protein